MQGSAGRRRRVRADAGGEGGFSVLNLDGDGANGEAVFSGEGEVGGGGESGAAEPTALPPCPLVTIFALILVGRFFC